MNHLRITIALTVATIWCLPVQGQIAGLVAATQPYAAPEVTDDQPIEAGRIVTFQSQVLGEDRRLIIFLPRGYEQSDVAYPVAYLLDGETKSRLWAAMMETLAERDHIPAMIAVGIVNKDRHRDMMPQGEDTSRLVLMHQAIAKEIIPLIESRYRTKPFRLIAGHSLGGLFALYAGTSPPRHFDAVVALDPSVQEGEALVTEAAKRVIRGDSEAAAHIATVMSNVQPWVREPYERYVDVLDQLSNGPVTIRRIDELKEDHGSILTLGYHRALRAVFADWRLPLNSDDLDKVKMHFARQSRILGYEVLPTERTIVGYIAMPLFWDKRYAKAIEFFEWGLTLYPQSQALREGLARARAAAAEAPPAA